MTHGACQTCGNAREECECRPEVTWRKTAEGVAHRFMLNTALCGLPINGTAPTELEVGDTACARCVELGTVPVNQWWPIY